MEGRSGGFYVSALLCVIAIVIFCLAAFGADVGDMTPTELVALGLAFFAGSHVIP